jgi:hypothetical protein
MGRDNHEASINTTSSPWEHHRQQPVTAMDMEAGALGLNPSSVPQPPTLPGDDQILCPNCKHNLGSKPVLAAISAEVAKILLIRHAESLHASIKPTVQVIADEFTNLDVERTYIGTSTSPGQASNRDRRTSIENQSLGTPWISYTGWEDLFPSH